MHFGIQLGRALVILLENRDRHLIKYCQGSELVYNLSMPRIARVVAVGYPHHITQRGNYRQDIFENDAKIIPNNSGDARLNC